MKSRTLFKEFRWSDESIDDWQPIWGALWRLNIGWAWSRGDHYARRLGNNPGHQWTVFTAVERNWIYGDLDNVAPLPSVRVIKEMLRWATNRLYAVPDGSKEEENINEVTLLIEEWLQKYGAVNGTAPLL